MLVTVTNQTTGTINTPATRANTREFTGIDGYTAEGGDLLNALPWPFRLVGELAAAGSVQRAMHEQDFRKVNYYDTHDPAQLWNHLVQKGTVTFAVAAETDSQDVEDDFISNI